MGATTRLFPSLYGIGGYCVIVSMFCRFSPGHDFSFVQHCTVYFSSRTRSLFCDHGPDSSYELCKCEHNKNHKSRSIPLTIFVLVLTMYSADASTVEPHSPSAKYLLLYTSMLLVVFFVSFVPCPFHTRSSHSATSRCSRTTLCFLEGLLRRN